MFLCWFKINLPASPLEEKHAEPAKWKAEPADIYAKSMKIPVWRVGWGWKIEPSSGDWLADRLHFHLYQHSGKQPRNKKCRRASKPAGNSIKAKEPIIKKTGDEILFVGLVFVDCTFGWHNSPDEVVVAQNYLGSSTRPMRVFILVRRLIRRKITLPYLPTFREATPKQEVSSGE